MTNYHKPADHTSARLGWIKVKICLSSLQKHKNQANPKQVKYKNESDGFFINGMEA